MSNLLLAHPELWLGEEESAVAAHLHGIPGAAGGRAVVSAFLNYGSTNTGRPAASSTNPLRLVLWAQAVLLIMQMNGTSEHLFI